MTAAIRIPATDDERWSSVCARDATQAGVFVYAVRTTRIYCRPGCPARTPRRDHVEFFPAPELARAAGYRACLRCRPDRAVPRDSRVAAVLDACRSLTMADPAPSLADLAARAGFAPSHFQRMFRALLGVTPKQFADATRMRRFRGALRSDAPVSAALHDAGFATASRAYAHADSALGMSPSIYKQQGSGTAIHWGFAPSALGGVVVGITSRGICAVEFVDDADQGHARLQAEFPRAELVAADRSLAATIAEVVACIEAPGRGHALPLDLVGTAFQLQVWQALRSTLTGERTSYAELARRIGRPEAVRAVAGACARNRVAVLVPCHRVVHKDGGLSGYRWGVERKRTLLEREQAAADGAGAAGADLHAFAGGSADRDMAD